MGVINGQSINAKSNRYNVGSVQGDANFSGVERIFVKFRHLRINFTSNGDANRGISGISRLFIAYG